MTINKHKHKHLLMRVSVFSVLVFMMLYGEASCAPMLQPSSPPSSHSNFVSTEPVDPKQFKRKRVKMEDDDEETEVGTKRCIGMCGLRKELDMFHKDYNGRYGVKNICKLCYKSNRPKCTECSKRPVFGFLWKKPTHCRSHRKAGMTDVVHDRCVSCTKRPTFGTKAGKPLCCAIHKSNGMFDVVNFKCKVAGCMIQPHYGITKSEFCIKHKTDDMVYTVNTACAAINCVRQPIYALPGNKAELCSSHATQSMVNVLLKRCKTDGCDVSARYGFSGMNRVSCATHKISGMLFLKNTKCIEGGCSNNATHGIGHAIKCEIHALITHDNLIERECGNCGLVQVLNQNNKCEYCDVQLTEPGKVHLQKQKQLQAEFDADDDMQYYDFTDRQITVEQDVNCSTNYRPDFIWDFGTHLGIVENDEHQHRGANYQCDVVRMLNITENLRRPAVFIRFNCDAYKVNGQIVKTGWIERVKDLKKWFLYIQDVSNLQGVVSVVYLYYDEYDSKSAEIIILKEKYNDQI